MVLQETKQKNPIIHVLKIHKYNYLRKSGLCIVKPNSKGKVVFKILSRCFCYVLCVGTWIDLSVCSNTVSIHNVLETRGELVGLVVSRWSLFGLHSVQDGGNRGTTPFLHLKK